MKRLLNVIKQFFGFEDKPKEQPVKFTPKVPEYQSPFSRKVRITHNNRKRTPGRVIQIIPVVKKKSHFYQQPCRAEDGSWALNPVWVPDVMATKVIYHSL